MGIVRRLISPIVELRESETGTALMMFAYSFLAMTAYNIVQPITRSRFISSPRRRQPAVRPPRIGLHRRRDHAGVQPAWRPAARQVGRAGHAGRDGGAARRVLDRSPSWGWTSVDVGFYLFGQIYGILLISQFWTLANIIFDPRQAKRLFGFIGGGASLGGDRRRQHHARCSPRRSATPT